MNDSKLTAKQAAFVREYCVDWNATQAAIRAGYSEKTARQIGEQNLSKLYIKKAIEDKQKKCELNAVRRAEDVLKDLAEVRAVAMKRRFNDAGDEEMINPNAALKALELEGKHLAMWTDKTQLSGSIEHKVTRIKLVDMDGDSNC